jgi:hypothetical protein
MHSIEREGRIGPGGSVDVRQVGPLSSALARRCNLPREARSDS